MSMRAEVNRNVELVQVIMFLTGQQEKTYQKIENKTYTDAISQWFEPYKEHTAVKLTRELVQTKYFFHIRPLQAILELETITEDVEHQLYHWATEVKKFIADTRFDTFFESQQGYYNWILEHINSCELDIWIRFIEEYFRQKPDEFHLIICPLAGNYGFTLEKDSKNVSYAVRFAPKYFENGTYDWNFDFFAKGVAHEYAHCFVNPTVEASKEILADYREFFEQHKEIPNFYNTDYAVINEYFVRAFQIRFMEMNKLLFPTFDIVEEYKVQKEKFIFIERFVNGMKEFETCDKSFAEFYRDQIGNILDVRV